MSFDISYVKPWVSADSGRAIVWKPFLWLPKRTGENYSLDIERIEGQILLLYTLKIFMAPLSVPMKLQTKRKSHNCNDNCTKLYKLKKWLKLHQMV